MKNSVLYSLIGLLAVTFAGCSEPMQESNSSKPKMTDSVVDNSLNSLQSLENQTANSSRQTESGTSSQLYRATVDMDSPTKSGIGKVPSASQDCIDKVSAETIPPRFWIGVCSQRAPTALLAQLDLRCGVVIDRVFAGSPAENILQKHDVIYKIDGAPVRCGTSLGCGINERMGSTIKFSVYRNGQPVEVSIKPQMIQQVGNEIIQITHISDYEKILCSAAFEDIDLSDPNKQIELVVIRPGFQLESGTTTSKSSGCQGELKLQMTVNFRENDKGELIVVVREKNTTSEYTRDNISLAPLPVQQFLKELAIFQRHEAEINTESN